MRPRNKTRKQFTEMKQKKTREIYIQEFLRGYRSELILKKISEKFLISIPTLYQYIRPAKLTKEIKAGKFKKDENYVSLF